jgi:hypothetical protein
VASGRVVLDARIGIDGLAEAPCNSIYDSFLSFLKALERGYFHKLYGCEAVTTCVAYVARRRLHALARRRLQPEATQASWYHSLLKIWYGAQMFRTELFFE